MAPWGAPKGCFLCHLLLPLPLLLLNVTATANDDDNNADDDDKTGYVIPLTPRIWDKLYLYPFIHPHKSPENVVGPSACDGWGPQAQRGQVTGLRAQRLGSTFLGFEFSLTAEPRG